MRKFKAGDQVVFNEKASRYWRDITHGKVYQVEYRTYPGSVGFLDDVGDWRTAPLEDATLFSESSGSRGEDKALRYLKDRLSDLITSEATYLHTAELRRMLREVYGLRYERTAIHEFKEIVSEQV